MVGGGKGIAVVRKGASFSTYARSLAVFELGW